MAYKIFLDVNVVADFFDELRLEHASAINLFQKIDSGMVFSYFSESVVNTTSYILRKIISPAEFIQLMNEMLSFISILPCNNDTVINAYYNAKNDLEDAVLYQIALENKMDYFVTSDIKDYKKIAHPLLPVVNAKKMAQLIVN